jgi:NitT/TauT family transport system substrate-binding protein
MVTRTIAHFGFVAFLVLVCGAPTQAADKINLAVIGSAVDTPFYIARDKGYFKDEDLEVNFINFDSGARVIVPLATGDLDIGSGALSVSFYNAMARGVLIRIVADKGHTAPGFYYQSVFVRKDLIDDGAVRGLKDLKGKRMGFAAPGVTALSVVNEAATAAGISFDDIEPVYMNFPMQVVALKNRAIDASILVEPAATLAANEGFGVRFMNTEEFYPNDQIAAVFYTHRFASARPDAARKFMQAYLRGLRTYTDALTDGRLVGPKAREVADTMVTNFRLRPELIAQMYSPALDPDGALSTASIRKDFGFFRNKGWLTGSLDLDQVIDTSIAKKASAELGPYRPMGSQ